MEKKVIVEFKDHNKVLLTDEIGNTYTSNSEELKDFLHGCSKMELTNKKERCLNCEVDMEEFVAHQCPSCYSTKNCLCEN